MAFILTFVFVAIFGILSITNSETITSDDLSAPSSPSVFTVPPPYPYGCQEFNCSRNSNPICSTTGDLLATDKNRCYYNQRVRCVKQWSPDGPSPIFLHEGECRGTECIGNAPRIYKPVCSSVDGVAETDANKSLFEIKRECAKNFRDREGKKKPIVRLLHQGACYGNEDKCWRKCSNAKKSVCGTIDGYLTTERNRCILNNKIRCNNILRNQGQEAQTVTFLHTGSCEGDELECNGMCPRSYTPVCSSVNGRLITVDRCVLRRRIQCDKKLRKLGRKNVPKRILKYNGECRSNGNVKNKNNENKNNKKN